MSHLGIVLGLAAAALGTATAQKAPQALAEPAKIDLRLSPETVAPGGSTQVTLTLRPIAGVKINRYPKIKFHVPAQAGLVGEALVEVGNAAPPPPDAMETNYFKGVDPLRVDLVLDRQAPVGAHRIVAQLSYFYCVTESGFCAPARVPVSIPVAVR